MPRHARVAKARE